MITLLLAASAAHADLPPPERWLATGHVAIGLAEDGSLGNTIADLGLVFDPDGPDGPMPVGADVLAVGRTYELWSLTALVGGSQQQWVQQAPAGGSALVLEWGEPVDDGALTWLYGAGGDEVVLVDAWAVLPWGEGVAWLVLDLTAQQDLAELAVTRVYDPDIDDWAEGSTSTTNAVGEGGVVASGAWDGRGWALAARDGVGGICSWCTLPAEVAAGSTSSTGDHQLGVAVEVGELAAGDTVRLLFAYGFGETADDALDTALLAAASEDLDGDGSDWWTDCDDLDGTRSPEHEERANGIDDDCDGEVDEVEPGDTGSDREGWDSPIPDDDDDGQADDQPGGQADGDADRLDPNAGGSGCQGVPLAPGLLGVLLSLLLPRRRP